VIIRELTNLPLTPEDSGDRNDDSEELIVCDGLDGPYEGKKRGALHADELVRQM
jgi:hypothetical protein